MTIPTYPRWSWSLRTYSRLASAPLACAVAGWLVTIAVGFGLLWRHQGAAGETQQPPDEFPASAAQFRAAQGYTLLLFAHPHCPCTRASLQELFRLLAQTKSAVKVHVIFPRAAEVGSMWDDAPIVQIAKNTDGINTSWDDNGEWAQTFGARTSGHVLLYDPQGKLLFSGGLTPLRAHEGASVGNQAVLAHLRGESSAPARAPVFGCSLFDPPAERESP